MIPGLQVKVRASRPPWACGAFTLIELLVVVSIIALLIAMITPSFARSRSQSKAVHCLARLKELGMATATYADAHGGLLPPAELAEDWHPAMRNFAETERVYVPYAWAELLYEHVYRKAQVTDRARYPVQRNHQNRYPQFAICAAGRPAANHAGHYRVYLPGWCYGSYALDSQGRMSGPEAPRRPSNLSRLPNYLVLMGDSREDSEAGDELPELPATCPPNICLCYEECEDHVYACESSYIGANHWLCNDGDRVAPINEANQAFSDYGEEFVTNAFSDRHMGKTNYLLSDFHAEASATLQGKLACDYDLNGVTDVGQCAREPAGCRD